MEPHRINGGMISGHLQTHANFEVQQYTLLRHNVLTNVVIQGKSRETASSRFPQQSATTAAATTSLKTMARGKNVEENG